jgi:hypothetical protein
MHIEFRPDVPLTDESCIESTGHPFAYWYERIEAEGLQQKRRDAIQLLYNEQGRGKDVWWPTTIWVEYERTRGIVKKDGRPEGYNICCTKSFKATPSELFPHFSTEEAFAAWVTGWAGAMLDGAPFRCGPCTGAVARIRPEKDIRMSWSSPGFGPSEVEIQFTVMGAKTTVNIFHKRLATRDEADGLRRAWGDALDRLKSRIA